MTEPTEMQQLIGQLAADALVRDALVVSLMEVIPGLNLRIEAKVAAMAPVCWNQLAQASQVPFQTRLAEVQKAFSDAAR